MLKLEITNDAPLTDVEALFKQIRISGTEEERRVIAEIEQGQYYDAESFIDRYGCKLWLSEMSTGCKAALCVLNSPDLTINLIECGVNALDTILTVCKEGSVVMRERGITICDHSSDGEIAVALDGYLFTNVERLNYYLSDERPFSPDFSRGGVQRV